MLLSAYTKGQFSKETSITFLFVHIYVFITQKQALNFFLVFFFYNNIRSLTIYRYTSCRYIYFILYCARLLYLMRWRTTLNKLCIWPRAITKYVHLTKRPTRSLRIYTHHTRLCTLYIYISFVYFNFLGSLKKNF